MALFDSRYNYNALEIVTILITNYGIKQSQFTKPTSERTGAPCSIPVLAQVKKVEQIFFGCLVDPRIPCSTATSKIPSVQRYSAERKGDEFRHGRSFYLMFQSIHHVRCAGAGGCCWSGVREKHYWLAGGWRRLLEWCERKTLLVGWRSSAANGVKLCTPPKFRLFYFSSFIIFAMYKNIFYISTYNKN